MRYPFVTDPELTAVAVMYKNKKLIADMVSPRIPVGKIAFAYNVWALAQGFTLPDDKVGRKGKPNKVNFDSTRVTSETLDHGLETDIPQDDIDNQPEGMDIRATNTEFTTNLVLLNREVRVATQVFALASYAAANRVTLAGGDQFSDFVNSDPHGVITDALDNMVMRPNSMTLGRRVFSTLARHPQIVQRIYGAGGQRGTARREDIAELFELDEINVGEAFVNTAAKGQAANMQRAWGNHIALHYKDLSGQTTENVMTFAFTAQYKTRIAGGYENKDIGLRGGETVRVGESVREVISANDLGYFIQNAIAP